MNLSPMIGHQALLVAFMLLLISCTTTSTLQENWILSVGKDAYPVQIAHLNSNEVMLTSSLEEISGTYSIQQDKLILIQAKQPRITEIIFERNSSGNWVLTRSPPSARLSTPIFGATLISR